MRVGRPLKLTLEQRMLVRRTFHMSAEPRETLYVRFGLMFGVSRTTIWRTVYG